MNKTILITGANRGIGLALTKLSLEQNFNVEACCRNIEKSIELNNLSQKYNNLNISEMDVTKSESINEVSNHLKKSIDILVCNVGSGASVPPGKESISDWQKMININLFSTVLAVENSRKHLAKTLSHFKDISLFCNELDNSNRYWLWSKYY